MKIEFSQEQLNVIDQALQQLPYNVAKPLIDHISRQRNGQGKHVDIVGRNPIPPLPDGCVYLNRQVTNPEGMTIGHIIDNYTMLC